MLTAQEASEEQEQALEWEFRVEAIFNQMFPQLDFEPFVIACAALMSEKRLAQAYCDQVNQTRAAETAALTSFTREIHTKITQAFLSLRERLIILQQERTRRVATQEAQDKALNNQAYLAAQRFEGVTAAVSQLAIDINKAGERAEPLMQKVKMYCRG